MKNKFLLVSSLVFGLTTQVFAAPMGTYSVNGTYSLTRVEVVNPGEPNLPPPQPATSVVESGVMSDPCGSGSSPSGMYLFQDSSGNYEMCTTIGANLKCVYRTKESTYTQVQGDIVIPITCVYTTTHIMPQKSFTVAAGVIGRGVGRIVKATSCYATGQNKALYDGEYYRSYYQGQVYTAQN